MMPVKAFRYRVEDFLLPPLRVDARFVRVVEDLLLRFGVLQFRPSVVELPIDELQRIGSAGSALLGGGLIVPHPCFELVHSLLRLFDFTFDGDRVEPSSGELLQVLGAVLAPRFSSAQTDLGVREVTFGGFRVPFPGAFQRALRLPHPDFCSGDFRLVAHRIRGVVESSR